MAAESDEGESRRRAEESVLDWVWEVDAGGVCTYVSPRVTQSLGREPVEIVGKTLFDLMAAEESRRARAEYDRITAERRPFAMLRATSLHRDGREIVLEMSGVPIFDEQGGYRGYCGFTRDTTSHERTEIALIESRNMLQAVLDAIPVRVFWKDRDSTYLGCNARFAADAGLDEPDQVVGKNDFELSWREEADLYRGDDRRVIESGESKIHYEEPQSWPDGTRLWLRTSKMPLTDVQGQIVGVLGCYEDITERKEAELALRRYAHILSATSDMMAFVDRELVFQAVNRACAESFGLTTDEMVGQSLPDVFGRDRFSEEIGAKFARCLNGEEVAYRDWFSFPLLGRRFVDARGVPFIEKNGQTTGVVVSARDVTDWKRTEEERRGLESRMLHAQKLESLGILAGGIAHDFNNLLTGILGNIGLASRRVPESSPALPHLRDVEQAAVRASDLCRQMLAYSGRGRFLVQPLDLSKIVEEMTQLLHVSISKKAVLRLRLVSELPAVDADPAQIRQVMMNLITNASDAIGEEPGVITVATGQMDCDRQYLSHTYLDEDLPEGRYVFVEVSDTGCGMEPETRSRLFDPFFTTKFTGRGLGMAAVLGILRGHRGAIQVYSEPGHGTTVKVLLPPSQRAARELPEELPHDDKWRGTGTVLVVDDEETVRKLAAKALRSAGFAVLLASDGGEALEIYRAHPDEIVAVLLDLTMPGIGGEETFRELRRIRKDVAVLLSSGYNEQEVTNRFAGQGLAAFIQKPYRVGDLLAKLRAVLEK